MPKLSIIPYPLIGLGCESITEEFSEVIDIAMQEGCHFFDTANCYQNGASEIALGNRLRKYPRERFILCTKVGVEFASDSVVLHGDPKYIQQACDDSLQRLQMDYIDLYYLHRVDPKINIEDSMLALKELVKVGKIRGVGLSEVTANQIRRANRIHPISAVQIEYSPWSRDDEFNNVISVCKELNIKIISCSPLGRAFFTHTSLNDFKKLPRDDYRGLLPRYQDANIEMNLESRKALEEFADNKECTLAQLVLAWEINKGCIPIPGTKNIKHFRENMESVKISLSDEDVKQLDNLFGSTKFHGARYPNEQVGAIYPEEPYKKSTGYFMKFFHLIRCNKNEKEEKKVKINYAI